MVGTLRKLFGHGSEKPATDGGTETGQFSFVGHNEHAAAVRDRYGVESASLPPDLPDDAREHLDGLLDETRPEPDAYVPAYEAAGVGPTEFVAAHEAAVDEAATGITEIARANDEQASTVEDVIVTIEEVQQQTEAASKASERIVEATQDQSETVSELSGRVEQLRADDDVRVEESEL